MTEVAATEAWEARDDVVFLDVREQHEWDAGHIDGAQHVPMSMLGGFVQELPRDQRIVAVCRSGSRSRAVTSALDRAGFDVVNLTGGMKSWAASDLPYISADGASPRVA